MHYFCSTTIRAASYNAATGTLTLWFASDGEPREYHEVPEHVFSGLLNAPSKGTYYNSYIRSLYST